jgi:NTE family protein
MVTDSSGSTGTTTGTTTSTTYPCAPQPVNLVLEGGGVKGIGLVGAISVLEEHGFTFVRVAGTSAGAIVGSLVAAGFTSTELHDLMASLDYTKFRDASALERALKVTEGLDLWFHEGMYKGEYFHQWIRDQLNTKGTRVFGDLRTDAGSGVPDAEQYKLVVMASDVSQGELVRLPWAFVDPAHPRDEQPIADAVRASMSIPFFFRPFPLDVYPNGPSVMVDGGMLSNFPIDTFDSPTGAPPSIPTIGIKLSARQRADMLQHQVKGDISLTMALLGTMQSWSDQMHLNDPGVIERTIFVDTLGVNATDFEITRAVQEQLFQNGRTAAENWLAG